MKFYKNAAKVFLNFAVTGELVIRSVHGGLSLLVCFAEDGTWLRRYEWQALALVLSFLPVSTPFYGHCGFDGESLISNVCLKLLTGDGSLLFLLLAVVTVAVVFVFRHLVAGFQLTFTIRCTRSTQFFISWRLFRWRLVASDVFFRNDDFTDWIDLKPKQGSVDIC